MTMTITASNPSRCISARNTAETTAAPAPVKRRRRTTPNPDTVKPNSSAALLQSAAEVRQTLRDSLVQVNALIREVKAQRRQDRLLQTTMDSLRKLSLA
jgi:hypothetical protein